MKNNNGKYFLRITIAQNAKEPLEMIRTFFPKATNLSVQHNTWRININGGPAKDFLVAILPYLIVKRELALQVLDAIDTRNQEMHKVVTDFNGRWKKTPQGSL